MQDVNIKAVSYVEYENFTNAIWYLDFNVMFPRMEGNN